MADEMKRMAEYQSEPPWPPRHVMFGERDAFIDGIRFYLRKVIESPDSIHSVQLPRWFVEQLFARFLDELGVSIREEF